MEHLHSLSLSSKNNGEFYNVPPGGKIPDLTHFHLHEEDKSWSNELTVSALYYTGELTDSDTCVPVTLH